MSSTSCPSRQRLIVAITGATGAIYGVRLLEHLRKHGQVETHLMISEAGVLNLHQELDMRRKDVEVLADVVHHVRDVGACIASGSFASTGMVVAPCSMKTLAAVAHGLSDNLITRAADVVLKERRRLVLMVRETPFNLAHLRNMTAVTEMGGVIFPPLPGFYQRPASMEEMVDHTLGRMLDMFGISLQLTPEWQGMKGDRD
ncbi:UbiX family flavin prenyltransferase [Herbaspirillum frisingense]|uniref:UbiX family flavin prenyltransferase n=1 Tax=Herbaspirillum frisingense TaxID=92645 RepID=UPI0016029583|nr:UbiX family flavin prenyltransferase [Herbaspirillum frisingense]QNB09079.1 UbiX family flavin prenyltransferase [Herbaspirillum frisingense]